MMSHDEKSLSRCHDSNSSRDFSIVLYYTIRLFNINRQHKPSIALEFGTSGINLTLAFLKIILFRVISQLEFYENSALEIGIYCRLQNEQSFENSVFV